MKAKSAAVLLCFSLKVAEVSLSESGQLAVLGEFQIHAATGN